MDTSTLDLYHVLQSGPYDEAGLSQVKRLLGGQRRLLRSKTDLQALEQLISLLQDWATAAGGGWLSASALAEAAEIAELDLRSLRLAEQLRSQAIVTGRAASGMPAPLPESMAMQGAIDANAELLHELKTLPPGALTQTLVTEESEATEELDVEALRESSIPRPRAMPVPTLRSDAGYDGRSSGRPRTLHGYIAPDSSFGAGSAALQAETDGLDDADAQRDSSVEARRATPVPTLLSETTAQSDFPARLRSTPPAALRSVTEPRRASSVPAQPRSTSGATAAAASQARHPGVPTQPLRLTPLPQLSLDEHERTQEVHTIDLELHPTLSLPPLTAAEPANDDALSAQIALAEQALEFDTSPDRVRELAELYVKREAKGDREQAADLYCTLGEVLGNPAGIAMLDRALALVPDHAEAKTLLTRYAVPRMPISAPKITVLGLPPKLPVPHPPPPAAVGRPSMAAGTLPSSPFAPAASLAPLSAASEAQRTGASLPPQASVQAAARATLPGTGRMDDVLSLHGVPQVVSTPPAVPPISSLTPIVRSDASELQARRLSVAKNSYVALGGIALSAAAALGLYLSVRSPSNHNADPLARPATTEQTAAANQPLAKAPEPEPEREPEPETKSNKTQPVPLAPPGPSHLPLLKLEAAQLRGGKLSETQLTAALGKVQPKLLACYEQAIEKKPRIKGRMIYGFTVRTNGRATNIKRVGGTLKDDALLQCSAKVIETVRFPKPRKSSQVKLPIQYKRT
jgi:hypothetical protein